MTHNQKVLSLLSDGKPHVHHELYELGVIAHSRVADLRKCGYNIACWKESVAGETVSVYQLVGTVQKSDLAAGLAPGLSPRSDDVPAARGIETPSAPPVQLTIEAA